MTDGYKIKRVLTWINEPYSTQGPCEDGFHVPTKDEWDGVKTILTGLNITTKSDYSSKLHMPLAALRSCYQNTDIGTSYTEGFYWSSTHSSSNGYAWMFWLYDYSGFPQSYKQAIAWGYNIRPFKDTFMMPDSGWTIISGTLGNAGIFRNQNDGLISITGNGTTGHTMADKNLGATTVRSSGDTLSESNAGKYYQRGNNYGFPGIGNSETFTTTTTKIDASTYGPGNSYDSSTYFYSNNASDLKWDSSNNANLRGGENPTGGFVEKQIYPAVQFATQGPCQDGFHVPLSSEWESIYNAGVSLGAWSSSNGVNFATYLKMPYSGYRNYNKTIASLGENGNYYSSSSDYNRLFIRADSIVPKDTLTKSFGATIRAFRDSPVAPDSTWTELYTNGIYHNSTLGLISVKNGSSWITIADKNLGATTVYNYGDTLTNANCGNVFQWGNNYAFPGTKSSDSIPSTATRVDASSYGPGNYYNSSTWIMYNGDWSSVTNDNLRGGVDGNVPVS